MARTESVGEVTMSVLFLRNSRRLDCMHTYSWEGGGIVGILISFKKQLVQLMKIF